MFLKSKSYPIFNTSWSKSLHFQQCRRQS